MRSPGRTIWDTRAQSICGIISARDEFGVHLLPSASFAQVSIFPPRMIVNPNRMHSIERAVHQTGRFAINVLSAQDRDLMVRLMALRRRQTDKERVLGIKLSDDHHQIPY